MKIIVTFAVPSEFAPWRRLRKFESGGDGTFVMRNGEAEVHVFITGVGARKCCLPDGDIYVISGVAGSLKEEHGIGKILVAKNIRTEGIDSLMTSDGSLVSGAARADSSSAAYRWSACRTSSSFL